MDRYEVIGEGRQGSYPYEVGIHWETPVPDKPRPVGFAEGSGHGSAGGYFPLSDVLLEIWTEHLRLCGCLWLRDLATQEQSAGRFFSADEIHAAWLAHRKKE